MSTAGSDGSLRSDDTSRLRRQVTAVRPGTEHGRSLALLAGCLVALGMAARLRIRRGPPWLAAILVESVALVAALLIDASTSRYVVPAGEPTVQVGYGEGRVTVVPATMPAGRASFVGPRTGPDGAYLAVTWELTEDQRAALQAGKLTAATSSGVYERTRIDLSPGVHAVVALDPGWVPGPGWDGREQPILAAATFAVAPSAAPQRARGDAGPVQVAGLVAALAIHGAAVFAFVAWAVVRGRSGSRGRGVPIGIPATAAAVTTIVLGAVILLAVDLAHNPF